MATATPYLDIAKAYEQKARQNLANQENAMAQQLATSKQATAASYDSAAAGNYVNYMKQQNAIGEQLARQGIRGGASESAMARIGNNYALNQGNTAASRAAAMGQLQNAYNNNLLAMRQQAEENIANNNMALQQSQVQYDDTMAQRAKEEARYREELERAIRERQEDIAREDKIRSDTWAREDLLTKQANERDDALRQAAWAREDSQLSAANAREDALRKAAWTREDELTAAANAREDARYREEVERAMRERQEDIDREAKYRYEDQAIAERRYADEQKWKQTEWTTARQDKQIEQYAATISRWTNVSSINQELQKLYNQQKSGKSTALTYSIILLLEQRKAELESGGR